MIFNHELMDLFKNTMNEIVIYFAIYTCIICLYIYIFLGVKIRNFYWVFKLKKQIKHIEKANKCSLLIIVDDTEKNLALRNKISNIMIFDENNENIINYIAEQYNYQCPPIHILLHTTGGCEDSSDTLIKLLHHYPNKKIGIVPRFAHSAGTMCLFACDEFYVNPYTTISPTDVQMEHTINDIEHMMPSGDYFKSHGKQKYDVQTLDEKLLITQAKKSYDENIRNIRMLQSKNPNIRSLIYYLASGNFPHHKLFTLDNMLEMGLNVKLGVKREYMDILHCMKRY